jgi:2-C-methyl-D-erythritol 2,4-cyclodiphosphate synthase
MKTTLAGILEIAEDCISIKATTTEKLGFTGREEGIEAFAVTLLYMKT